MEIYLKYPAPRGSARSPRELAPSLTAPKLAQVLAPGRSRWRESTTDKEIGQAILEDCRHSKELLNRL
jgi:hypothetical protein